MQQLCIVSFDEALERSLALATQEPSTQWVGLLESLGRVLGKEILCCKNLPSYNNAAMDGFAFAHANIHSQLRIKKRILAGETLDPCLEKDECYKIMTGAQVPSDADTIVPFERCTFYDEESVRVPLDIKKGNALRIKGEEQRVGTSLAQKGEKIDASMIALFASQGITHVEVYRKVSIVVLSTGDELKKPWEKANEDQIYDINAFAIIALLKEQGFDAHYGGVVPDDLDAAIAYFGAMKAYDVVVTSGGVSMGEADFVEKALVANGFESSFHGINIKPGKPTMFGKMGQTLLSSLPGNPLAAYVNAFVFLIPMLRKREGALKAQFDFVTAINETHLTLKSGRVNLVLGQCCKGRFKAFDDNNYGSGMIMPLVKSNCILVSDENTQSIEAGKEVKIIIFKSFSSKTIEHLKN